MTQENRLNLTVVVFATLAIIGLTRAFGPWVLGVAGLGLAYFFLAWRIRRAIDLRRKGYFSGHSEERPEFRRVWIYEEVQGSDVLTLQMDLEHIEPGRWELLVPTQPKWEATVPVWAKDRRDEIVGRIAELFPADRITRENDAEVA